MNVKNDNFQQPIDEFREEISIIKRERTDEWEDDLQRIERRDNRIYIPFLVNYHSFYFDIFSLLSSYI